MVIAAFQRTTCRLCDGRDLDLVLQFEPIPIADGYVAADQVDELQQRFPLEWFLCRSCGHVQLLQVVDPAALFANFNYVSTVSLGLVEHFRRAADEMIRDHGLGGTSLVVDVGSNDGSYLRPFKERGVPVLGVDPAREIARQATASGIETMPEFFDVTVARQIRTERGPAALVTANNAFAHSDNLGEMADGVRELLAPGGVFVFEVSYLGDVVRKGMIDTVYHEHLAYHSVKPLERFMGRHGLELIDVKGIASKGGSLRAVAQHAGGPRTKAPSVAEFVAQEEAAGLDRPEAFRKLDARLRSARNKLRQLLHDLKGQGKSLAGFGASPGCTTLLYYFGLGDLLCYLVDDNPRKHGLYSPGHHLPVYPSQALYERKPDHVVILAWTYSQPIVKKNQAFLERGGHFIVPLPDVEVL